MRSPHLPSLLAMLCSLCMLPACVTRAGFSRGPMCLRSAFWLRTLTDAASAATSAQPPRGERDRSQQGRRMRPAVAGRAGTVKVLRGEQVRGVGFAGARCTSGGDMNVPLQQAVLPLTCSSAGRCGAGTVLKRSLLDTWDQGAIKRDSQSAGAAAAAHLEHMHVQLIVDSHQATNCPLQCGLLLLCLLQSALQAAHVL